MRIRLLKIYDPARSVRFLIPVLPQQLLGSHRRRQLAGDLVQPAGGATFWLYVSTGEETFPFFLNPQEAAKGCEKRADHLPVERKTQRL
jgi:hypothetical protein